MEWIVVITTALFAGLVTGVCLDTKRELRAYRRGKKDGYGEGYRHGYKIGEMDQKYAEQQQKALDAYRKSLVGPSLVDSVSMIDNDVAGLIGSPLSRIK